MSSSPESTPVKATITSKEQFDKLMAEAKGPVIIDFLANDCGACVMEPAALEKLKADCNGNPVTIGSVDVEADWASDLADKLDVAGTPTALFAPTAKDFLDGKVQEVEPGSEAIRKKLKCAR